MIFHLIYKFIFTPITLLWVFFLALSIHACLHTKWLYSRLSLRFIIGFRKRSVKSSKKNLKSISFFLTLSMFFLGFAWDEIEMSRYSTKKQRPFWVTLDFGRHKPVELTNSNKIFESLNSLSVKFFGRDIVMLWWNFFITEYLHLVTRNSTKRLLVLLIIEIIRSTITD